MAKNKNNRNDKIRIGVDSNIIVYLSKFTNPIFDPNGNIHKLLERQALCPEAYENIPVINLPPLLQDGFLGSVTEFSNGTKLYANLMDIKYIYDSILSGKLEICVSPTVYFEIEEDFCSRQFVETYATRLQISDKDSEEFFNKRLELAEKYSKYIPKERSAILLKSICSADACIMAEYSLFGLNMITVNAKHLIHKYPTNKDFIIANGLKDINRKYGLIFKTKDSRNNSPTTHSLGNFVGRMKRAEKEHSITGLYFENLNIDENNMYIKR